MNKLEMRGFTLIELMIVVAIIGILAALAYPSFLQEVREARRSDGIAGLIATQLKQEKYRSNNTTYTINMATLGASTASPDGYYTLSVTAADATSYTLSADAINAQNGDAQEGTSCDPLTMNQNGVISPAACVSN